MNYKILRAYLHYCSGRDIEATFEGLEKFRKEVYYAARLNV